MLSEFDEIPNNHNKERAMKRWMLVLMTMTAGGLFLLAGCSENAPQEPSVVNDQEAMSQMIGSDALFTSDASYLNDGDASLGKVDTAIAPRNWGRRIDAGSVSRTVAFTPINDTTTEATVTHTFSGTFWIRARMLPDTTMKTYLKPFTETTVRKVKFVKVANTDNPRMNWRMREVSAMHGGTSAQGVTIDQVTFFVGDDTLTVHDPLTYFLKVGRMMNQGGMPELSSSFTRGFKVRVTITSTQNDSDIVSAHRPFWFAGGWKFRAPMQLVSSTDNGNGTFTRVYEHSWYGVWTGRHHLMVSAVTRSSLFDNVAPFTSEIWGIPFIVQ